jgi:modulator of FtsH protease HflC
MSAVDRVIRNPLSWAIAAAVVVFLLASSLVVVGETQQALVVRVGDPVRVVNRYRPNDEPGRSGAGLLLRVPFVEQVVWVDKRVLDFDVSKQEVLSTDQLRLVVDAFARFRIVDPLTMYKVARSERRVADALQNSLGSVLRNELGKREFAVLLTPERGQIMENIQASLNRIARQYGAEIVDVRIKRADLPSGPPLEAALQRMRNAREQEALTILARGYQQAQLIRADADAEAARVYSESFGKDPEFYDFYRAMQSYRKTFNGQGQSSVVLSPNNSYLREFEGR